MQQFIKVRLLILAAAGILASAGAGIGQDMRGYAGRSLFSDQKAIRVGDAVTILVVEATTASNDARTSSGREDNFSLSGSGSVDLPQVSAGLGSQFRGEGSTISRGSVRTKISTQVDSVLANGNLIVNGKRTIVVNGEEQILTISGVIRTSDIMADNSVYSFNLSDATIVFEGNGIVSQAQGPGILTKFLHFLF
jgi:flagellar L-ring protein precursor FlgH